MRTTVILTQGHISIKRGRVTRQYTDPTKTSIIRLCNLLNYGPADSRYTQRSSVHEWHGLSTLSPSQLKALRLYLNALRQDKDNRDYFYGFGVRDTCLAIGIHQVLLEQYTPCKHGKARSVCYTCYTEYQTITYIGQYPTRDSRVFLFAYIQTFVYYT